MRKTIITLLLILSFAMPVSADSVDAQLTAAKREINNYIDEAAQNAALDAYPDGAVYMTTQDIDEEGMSELFGGSWREINSAFLWATDGTQSYAVDEDFDGIDDNDGTVINELNRIGGRGGNDMYEFAAGLGTDDEGFAFWTDEDSGYVDSTATILEATAYSVGSVSSSILVVEKDSESLAVTILPPYTKVKVFERLGEETPEEMP